jgi:nitroreductase
MTKYFNYEDAFSRNIGWFTELEQQCLRTKRIAIAGMGGVGGSHLLTLSRLGIGNFNIADFDEFEVANFNRQAGAMMSTIHQPKADTLHNMAKDINPESNIKIFKEGVTEDTIDEFLADVDLYVDGLDFFVLDIRAKIFARCAELGIPAITAGPIGMSTVYLIFMPGQMTFEEYFGFNGLPDKKQYVNFLLGLTPKGLHRSYLMDKNRLNLEEKYGPSVGAACSLCSGVITIEAAKILLNRDKTYAAPYYHSFDAYLNKHVVGKLHGGAKNPLQRIKQQIGYRFFTGKLGNAPEQEKTYDTPIERILNLARYAPSGDNLQPWKFEIKDEKTVHVYINDVSNNNVFEYKNGLNLLLSAGALLRSIELAAPFEGLKSTWKYLKYKDGEWIVKVSFALNKKAEIHPLAHFVKHRHTNRKSYQRTPITDKQKDRIALSLDGRLEVCWFEGKEKTQMTMLNALSEDIRLRTPKVREVYNEMLDWKDPFPKKGLPISTVPLDPLTKITMKWIIKKDSRMKFFNNYLAGTVMPQIQVDIIPGINSAAHFGLIATNSYVDEEPRVEEMLKDGAALQNFWLTLTAEGLAMQPSTGSVVFAYYGRHNIDFGDPEKLMPKARKTSAKFDALFLPHVDNTDKVIFAGRVGFAKTPELTSRSLRYDLEDLLLKK